MTFGGAQLAGNMSSGGNPAGNGTASVTGKAIRSVTASSNADTKSKDASSQSGDNAAADEVASVGKAEQKSQTLTADHSASRLSTALQNLNNPGLFGLGTALPPGMFGAKLYNLNAGLMPIGFGAGAVAGSSKDPWEKSVAKASLSSPDYGTNSSGQGDPTGNVTIGNMDPLYKGPRPDNLTVLGATNSRNYAYGTGSGTIIAEQFSSRIAKGESLGSILTNLGSTTLQAGDGQSQIPRLTGDGLSPISYDASKSNLIRGKGIVLIGEDGNGGFHVGTELGGQKMAKAMSEIGLDVKIVRNEQEFEAAVKEAQTVAKEAIARGEKPDLVWGHIEAHGGIATHDSSGNGGHSSKDIGFISAGGGYEERDAIGDLSLAHKEYKDVLLTTGACHSGSWDAYQTFEHLDKMFRGQVAEKPVEKPAEKAVDKSVTEVDKTKKLEVEIA